MKEVRTLLTEGTKAPAFTAQDTDGKTVKSEDLIGKQPFVLYFYPKDDTPGCTIEGCSFRDNSKEFETRGVKVYGVSVDDVASHKDFSDKFNFNFPLLADVGGKICAAYGVEVKDGKYPARVTFVVDKGGTIKKVFPKVSPKEHVAEVLQALDKN
jgi:peroxiredoxin Q/BCP